MMVLNFDYTEQLFTINFVTVGDIISRVGGYMAAFLPVLQIMTPLLLIYFLYTLGDAMRAVKTREYFASSRDFLNQVKTKLELLLESQLFHEDLEKLINVRVQFIEKVLAIKEPTRRSLSRKKPGVEQEIDDDQFTHEVSCKKSYDLVEMLLKKEEVSKFILGNQKDQAYQMVFTNLVEFLSAYQSLEILEEATHRWFMDFV
jgi:hypothetical protein